MTVLGVAAIVLGTAILLWSRLTTPPAPGAPPAAPAAGPGTPVAGGGVIVTLHAAPLAAGRNSLVVGVADPHGTPTRGAIVVVTALSLEMDMGTMTTIADERQPGHYTADVSLDMAGRRQVVVQVTRPGGPTATFSYLVALTGDEGPPPADSPSLSRLDSRRSWAPRRFR